MIKVSGFITKEDLLSRAENKPRCKKCGKRSASDYFIGMYDPFKLRNGSCGYHRNEYCMPCYLDYLNENLGNKE